MLGESFEKLNTNFCLDNANQKKWSLHRQIWDYVLKKSKKVTVQQVSWICDHKLISRKKEKKQQCGKEARYVTTNSFLEKKGKKVTVRRRRRYQIRLQRKKKEKSTVVAKKLKVWLQTRFSYFVDVRLMLWSPDELWKRLGCEFLMVLMILSEDFMDIITKKMEQF